VDHLIRLVQPKGAVEILGVELVGINVDNGKKLLFTLGFIVVIAVIGRVLRGLAELVLRRHGGIRRAFWTGQVIRLVVAVVMLLGLVSIWFDDPTRLATAVGLVTAGLAFALRKVVTAIAAYFVILRSKAFNVGDRITMGGVRGDVIALGFIQTTIMEMGQPPAVQSDHPPMWVRSRQYTGRIVTVTNDKIFDEPVYNYTRDFPYIWEEMSLPIGYTADRHRAETVILAAARKYAVPLNQLGEAALMEMERRYAVKRTAMGPRVYYRLTETWLVVQSGNPDTVS
jgi:small-conductance mechanosensitive channel